MLKINYKGYEISQADNNHVVICKDKQMLFHSQCNKKLDEEELKKQLEFYLKLNCLNLIEENQQLKDNWIKLKEWVNKNYDYYSNNADYIGGRLCFTDMKDKMQELEQGSDSNE